MGTFHSRSTLAWATKKVIIWRLQLIPEPTKWVLGLPQLGSRFQYGMSWMCTSFVVSRRGTRCPCLPCKCGSITLTGKLLVFTYNEVVELWVYCFVYLFELSHRCPTNWSRVNYLVPVYGGAPLHRVRVESLPMVGRREKEGRSRRRLRPQGVEKAFYYSSF